MLYRHKKNSLLPIAMPAKTPIPFDAVSVEIVLSISLLRDKTVLSQSLLSCPKSAILTGIGC